MTATNPPEICYARADGRLYIKVQGSATHLATLAADHLVAEFLQSPPDAPETVLDLADCSHVDSTFAGWMIRLRQRLARQRGRLLVARCPVACRTHLQVMGLMQLFEFVDVELPREMTCFKCTDPDGAADDEQIEIMLDAHEELSHVNENNEQVFSPIAHALRDELDKRRHRDEDDD